MGRVHGRVNVIFRRFGLFGGGAVLRGVALTPIRRGLVAGRRTGRGTLGLLTEINLSSGTSSCPDDLSNNRGRETTVIHSLTVGPGIVLFSRPASTLSPRVINRMLRIVHSLTSRKVAVVIIARRVNFTERITSGIIFVSGKIVYRRGAPRRFFARPRGPHLYSFLSGILWLGLWKQYTT